MLRIDFTQPVEEGIDVLLRTSPPTGTKGYKFRYEWTISPAGIPQPASVFKTESAEPWITWSTAGRRPGPYHINVKAMFVSAPKGQTPPSPADDEGDEDLVLMPGRFGRGDLDYVKRNVDQKMDALTQGVGRVANAVQSAADKIPPLGQPLEVALQKQGELLTDDLKILASFFGAIRNRTGAITFKPYNDFINRLLCSGTDRGYATCRDSGNGSPGISSPFDSPSVDDLRATAADYGSPSIAERRADLLGRPSIFGVDAYQLLKLATQAFLVFETGIVVTQPKDPFTGEFGTRDRNNNFIPARGTDAVPGESGHLGSSAAVTFDEITRRLDQYLGGATSTGQTYLRRIVDALIGSDPGRRAERLPFCDGILRNRFTCPSMIELIWSYWEEEGMLVQTLNIIALRFQNRRGPHDRDPLAHLEIDPLRPLNNLLWGYVQDEMHRLTVPRRAYEYDHHYGLTTYGKAVPALRSADSRSKFLEAFHNLLNRTAQFYHEDADTTVIADAFPLLNALREVHLILAEGAHNQFGDLPWTARAEMLVQQWLLARPEVREFLRGRAMVPYAEPWMGQVDTMKRLQGWSEVTITNFHELAATGEQILLSIRYHDWSAVNDQEEAKLWARYWKPEIQRYMHSYRAVTGVDLTTEPVDAKMPWVHLRNRLNDEQQRRRGGRP
jgi:hypothetical protein